MSLVDLTDCEGCRLGTRGNSRYCYAGLRKRLKLDPPLTPDISAEPGRARDNLTGGEEEVSNAASFLIREWVEKLLGVKFETLPGERREGGKGRGGSLFLGKF